MYTIDHIETIFFGKVYTPPTVGSWLVTTSGCMYSTGIFKVCRARLFTLGFVLQPPFRVRLFTLGYLFLAAFPIVMTASVRRVLFQGR